MVMTGVEKVDSNTVTSALLEKVETDKHTRSEYIGWVRGTLGE